jgi:SAM-dependent methyltransferase
VTNGPSDSSTFYRRIGDQWAAHYDSLTPPLGPESPMIRCITDVAGPGRRVLELGLGTGRVALALSAAGFDVTGIEISPGMLEVFRQKPGASDIRVLEGNFATADVGVGYDLVVCVFNTLYSFRTQQEQLEALRRAAAALVAGGRLLVEGFSPHQMDFQRGQAWLIRDVSEDVVHATASVHRAAEQQIDTQHLTLRPSGISFLPTALRYIWPSELDCLARLAGLELQERWGSYAREPFTSASPLHVALYAKPDDERADLVRP